MTHRCIAQSGLWKHGLNSIPQGDFELGLSHDDFQVNNITSTHVLELHG